MVANKTTAVLETVFPKGNDSPNEPIMVDPFDKYAVHHATVVVRCHNRVPVHVTYVRCKSRFDQPMRVIDRRALLSEAASNSDYAAMLAQIYEKRDLLGPQILLTEVCAYTADFVAKTTHCAVECVRIVVI